MAFDHIGPDSPGGEQYSRETEWQFSDLTERMSAQALNEKAPYSGSFFEAALNHLQTSPDFKNLIYNFLAARPELLPNHRLYLPLRCFQKQAMRDNSSYPKGFTAERWRTVISGYMADPGISHEIEWDLHNRHLQTNVSDRYKSLPPIVAWLRAHGRLRERVSILDIGCSVNAGLKKLALMDVISGEEFTPTQVHIPEDYDRPWLGSQADDELTEKASRLQNTPVNLGVSIGVDREDMSRKDNLEWARACLTPEEFVNGESESYDKLEIIRFPHVKFMKRDFLDNYEAQFLKSSPENHEFFDIVSLFTVLNQLSDRDRMRMLQVARRYVKPTGLVVIQDFARVDPDLPVEIQFLNNDWNKNFSYRTIVLDKLMTHDGYQEVWRYDGGRCARVQAGLGRIATADGSPGVNFYDFLRSA